MITSWFVSFINVFTRIRKVSCQGVYAIWCSFIYKTFSVKLLFFCELYLYWHYKLILRRAGVFGFLQKTLLLNNFAHPWYRTLDMKSNLVDSSHFENNFKRIINFPVTRVNMNEHSKQRTNWRYHCFLTYVTQQRKRYHVNFSFTVT